MYGCRYNKSYQNGKEVMTMNKLSIGLHPSTILYLCDLRTDFRCKTCVEL